MMLDRIRFGVAASGMMGVIWAGLGVFTSLKDVGVGMVVASASVIGWGLLDWLER